MSTLRDDLLADVDDIRGIPGELGIRLFAVSVVVVTDTGARPGLGSRSVTRTPIKTGLRGQNVKVRNITSRDVIASGGQYTDADIEVGPLTPPFAGMDEGNSISEWDPKTTTSGREVYYVVTGPGCADDGDWYVKITSKTDKAFRYMLTLRRTAKRPNV